MNSGVNALGQGNRANATIGRALQLVDPQRRRRAARARSTGPRSATRASTRSASPRTRTARRGSRCPSSAASPPAPSTVTLFAGEGPRGRRRPARRARPSRWPARSPPACARWPTRSSSMAFDAVLVVSPEHARVFAEAGWSKPRLRDELTELLQLPGHELVAGRGRHRRGPARVARRRDAPEVPPRRPADRPRRRRSGPVLGASSAAGSAARPAASPSPWRCRRALDVSRSSSIPTGERDARPDRERAVDRGRAVARRADRRPARHLQGAGRRVPRPARRAAPGARR